MRYSNEEVKNIQFLLQLMNLNKDTASELKKSFNRQNINPDNLQDFSEIVGIPSMGKVRGFLEFAAAPPAGNPKDLMAQGLKGPEIGAALAAAEAEAYAEFINEIRKYVRDTLRESQYGGPGVQQSIGYGKNYHTVDPQPNTWENYEGLNYDVSAGGDGYYYASVEVLDYPEMSLPTRKFPDEGSAEWWARNNYEKLHRVLMSKSSV